MISAFGVIGVATPSIIRQCTESSKHIYLIGGGRKRLMSKITTQVEWTHYTMCALVLYLVAPPGPTTFLIFQRTSMPIPRMHDCVFPFSPNLVRTQWQCAFARRRYTAANVQRRVPASSCCNLEWAWRLFPSCSFHGNKKAGAHSSVHVAQLTVAVHQEGVRAARKTRQCVSGICARSACSYDEVRLLKMPPTVLECRARALMRSTLIGQNGKRDSRRCWLTAAMSQVLSR